MKRIILHSLLTGFLCLTVFVSFGQRSGTNIFKEVLEETNRFRQSNNLPALVSRSELNNVAQAHSDKMAEGKVPFGHDGFEERQKEAVQQITTLTSFAENVAFGATSGRKAVEGWENSPGHRRNLLGNYKYIGIGIAVDKKGKYYYTQFFGGDTAN